MKLENKIEADLQQLLSDYIKDPEMTYDKAFDYDYNDMLDKLVALVKRYN